MLHAAIMTGVSSARKVRQAAEASKLKQPAKPKCSHSSDLPENYSTRSRSSIFEPRPEPTYNDINNFYEKKTAEPPAGNTRTAVRYIGAKTDSQLEYSNRDISIRQPTERKLVRRETIIASWKYLKNERERELGGRDKETVPNSNSNNVRGAKSRKVSRSHSERQNGGLGKFSSKRKSVIYTFDPVKKVLNQAYTFESDDSEDEVDSTGSGNLEKCLSNPSLGASNGDFKCQRSSSFTKIKTLFMRVFTNKSL